MAVSSTVEHDDDQRRDAIVLDDGTWVDVGDDGHWRPSATERVRAAVILGVFFAILGAIAIVASAGGDDDGGGGDVAADRDTSTTTTEATTTTTEVRDPSFIGDEPASERCSVDDRDGLPLRDRSETPVLVLNGTGRTGHAGAITDQLESQGYETVTPDNADRREITAIDYRPGYCAEAERAVFDLLLLGATVDPVARNLPVTLGRAQLVITLGADSL